MAKNLVRIKYTGDERDLVRSSRNAERSLEQLNKEGKRHFAGLKTAAAGASVAIGAGLAFGLKKSVDAAVDAERVQKKLEVALRNAGISYKAHAKQIDEVIQKHSRLTGLDDEELTESFSNMIRTTKNVNEALKLNAIAADIARTKGVDLANAQSLVARVYNGSFTGLKRLGIAIEPVTTAQDALKGSTKKASDAQLEAAKASDKLATRQQAIAILQKTFGGQAEAYGKTAAGAQDRVRVATENLEEAIGQRLLPAITKWANRLADLLAWSEKHKTATKAATIAVGALVAILAAGAAASKVYAAGQALAALATIGLGEAATTADKVMRLTMIGALFSAGVALVLLWKKSETFRDVVTAVFNTVKTVVVGAVKLVLSYVGFWLSALHGVLEAASHIPFIGDKFKAAARGVQAARDRVKELRDQIDNTKGKKVKVDAEVSVRLTTQRGGVHDGIIGAIGDGVRGEIVQNPWRFVPPEAPSGSTAGLKPMVLDDLAIATGVYGLHLTSGYRPGAVTATGRRSLHALGQAIDVAGPKMSMAMYAQAEAGRPGVAEVIYSPIGWWHPGAGWGPITNPTIKRAHYSHVHVGVTSAGDGLVSGDGLVGDGTAGKRRKPPRRTLRQARTQQALARATKAARGRGWGELPSALELRIFMAEDTPDTGDDLAAHQAALDYLRHQLPYAHSAGPDAELAVRRAIRDQQEAIRDLKKEPDQSEDLQAQLDQANRRLAAAQETARLDEAFVETGVFGGGGYGSSAGGGGGAVAIFNTLFPPPREYVRAAGKVVAEAFGGQGYRPASRQRLGV